MEKSALPYLLVIGIMTICFIASYALAFWLRDSRSTTRTKPSQSPEATPNSVQAQVAQLQTDQAALFATLEKLTTTVKRLSSRNGMRDLRDRAEEPPPIGTPKSELRKFYGIAAKSGPEQAAEQLQRERG